MSKKENEKEVITDFSWLMLVLSLLRYFCGVFLYGLMSQSKYLFTFIQVNN